MLYTFLFNARELFTILFGDWTKDPSEIKSFTFFFSRELLLVKHYKLLLHPCAFLYLMLESCLPFYLEIGLRTRAINREVHMNVLTVCSGLLVIIHKKRRTYMILFHCYALGSLIKSPNRMVNSSLALNREVYMRCSNSLQWFISNNSQEKKNVHDSIPLLCTRVLRPISK